MVQAEEALLHDGIQVCIKIHFVHILVKLVNNVLSQLRNIKPGEQVFIDYGEMPSKEHKWLDKTVELQNMLGRSAITKMFEGSFTLRDETM